MAVLLLGVDSDAEASEISLSILEGLVNSSVPLESSDDSSSLSYMARSGTEQSKLVGGQGGLGVRVRVWVWLCLWGLWG